MRARARAIGFVLAASLASCRGAPPAPSAPAGAGAVAATEAPRAVLAPGREPHGATAGTPAHDAVVFDVIETERPAPPSLRVAVEHAAGETRVRVAVADALVAIRRGTERAVGASRAELTLPAGDETRAPLVVEATSPTSLDTTRAVVRLAARGAPGERAAVRLAEPPVDVARDARFAHVCRAHADGFGGFAVVCRVATAANAADVAGDDAAEGVFVLERGHAALARLDVDLGARDFDAKAVGYNARGRGVVVRAEASRLPGEAAPSFVLASDARLQPVVPRRFICRMPLIDPTGDVAF